MGKRDEDIIPLYFSGDDDAEKELVDRYHIHAKIVVGDLYHQFCKSCRIEFEDMMSISLYCLFIALTKYKEGTNFYPYWKKITRNELYFYIKSNQIMYLYGQDSSMCVPFEEERVFASSDKIDKKSELFGLVEDIKRVLEIDIYKFTDVDKQIMYLYLEGYSVDEISNIAQIKTYSVRRRLKKMKEKISNILFNS